MNRKPGILCYLILLVIASHCVSKQKFKVSTDYYISEFGKKAHLTLAKNNRYYLELTELPTHYIDSGYFLRNQADIAFTSYIDKPFPIVDTSVGYVMWCYDKNNLETDTAQISITNRADRTLDGIYLTINDSTRIPVPTLKPKQKHKTTIVFKGDCKSNFITIHYASVNKKSELYKHMDLTVGIDTTYLYKPMLTKGSLSKQELILPVVQKDTLRLFGTKFY